MPLLYASIYELYATLAIAALTVAALVLGKPLLMPLAIAVVLAFVLSPVSGLLMRLRIPRSIAASLVVTTLLLTLASGSVGLGRQFVSLAETIENNRPNMKAKIESLGAVAGPSGPLSRMQALFSGEGAAGPPPPITPKSAEPVSPLPTAATTMSDRVSQLTYAVEPLVQFSLVLLFTLFLMLQGNDLRDRIARVAGTNNLSRTSAALADAATKLSQLFLAQAILNVVYGIFVGVGLWLLGVPNAVLWGVLAAAMRYVPFVGSIIAIAPPVLLAAAIQPDWSLALATLAFLGVCEFVIGQFVEPIMLGRRAGLTPLAMLLAAGFWALIWGPMGLVLAVPLTLVLVVLGRYLRGLEFASVLLGDQPALAAPEQFYHRLLANDALGAAEQVELAVTADDDIPPLDSIVLPTLQLASNDLEDEKIDRQRAEDICSALMEIWPTIPAAERKDRVDQNDIAIIGARAPFDNIAAQLLANAYEDDVGAYPRTIVSTAGLTAIGQLGREAITTNEADIVIKAVALVTLGSNDAAYVPLLCRRIAAVCPKAQILILDVGQTVNGNSSLHVDGVQISSLATTDELFERLRLISQSPQSVPDASTGPSTGPNTGPSTSTPPVTAPDSPPTIDVLSNEEQAYA